MVMAGNSESYCTEIEVLLRHAQILHTWSRYARVLEPQKLSLGVFLRDPQGLFWKMFFDFSSTYLQWKP
jgi:hypothetical protein